MELRELETVTWVLQTRLAELARFALRAHKATAEWRQVEPAFEGHSLEHLDEFFRLAEELTQVWATHSQGSALRGEITANTFKDVLDRNVLLSETANNKE